MPARAGDPTERLNNRGSIAGELDDHARPLETSQTQVVQPGSRGGIEVVGGSPNTEQLRSIGSYVEKISSLPESRQRPRSGQRPEPWDLKKKLIAFNVACAVLILFGLIAILLGGSGAPLGTQGAPTPASNH